MQRIIYAVVLILLSQATLGAVDDPLFGNNDLLEISIRAPFQQMRSVRDKDKRYDGQLTYQDNSGRVVALTVQLDVRGNSRAKKNVCKFPPLGVRFDRNEAGGTLFQNQRRLKLVTQCIPRRNTSEQELLKEYLAYRIFNEITDKSFRVRLLELTYVDSESGQSNPAYAFFIEHKRRLAARLGLSLLSIKKTSAVDLDSRHLNQVSLFQLLIGNVDWSATSGGTSDCCHNFSLFQDGSQPILAVPYDFDLSGLVNSSHAVPDRRLRQKKITDRRYRGYCRNNNFLDANTALFNDRHDPITALTDSFSLLTGSNRKKAKRYIDSFYRIINNPRRVDDVIGKYCHKSKFIEVEVEDDDDALP